jgi:hypothetical protein
MTGTFLVYVFKRTLCKLLFTTHQRSPAVFKILQVYTLIIIANFNYNYNFNTYLYLKYHDIYLLDYFNNYVHIPPKKTILIHVKIICKYELSSHVFSTRLYWVILFQKRLQVSIFLNHISWALELQIWAHSRDRLFLIIDALFSLNAWEDWNYGGKLSIVK